jgi:3-phosphoshikimate 1-carboxyvinyltransferase
VTTRTVLPGRRRGHVVAPPSKSYTHRALVAAFLSGREFDVRTPLDSEDTRATVAALRRLGSTVAITPRGWSVRPARRRESPRSVEIDCGESGTTLRFVTVLAALGELPVRFSGRGRLAQRPMLPLLSALTGLGAEVRVSGRGGLFTIRGPIHGGRIRLDASASSQFASALLLALPTLSEDSRITLEGTVVSAPYIDATLAVLRSVGIEVGRRGREIRIPGGQPITGRGMDVPGDASSAAYFWVAGAIAEGPVTVRGVPRDWPQADLAILALLRRSGADVRERGTAVSVRRGRPRPFTVDLTDAPDLYPLAGVLAATLPGTSRLCGAPQVVHKESDRRSETASLARALGAQVRVDPDGLEIDGTPKLRALDLRRLTDHRLVMSAAIGAAGAATPSHIGRAEAVRKSFPGFWDSWAELGPEVAVV